MKKRFLSVFLTAALFVQSAAVSVLAESDVTVVSSDKDTSWNMKWNSERGENGFSYISTDENGNVCINTESGLSISSFRTRYAELNNVAYPSKDGGATRSEKSGEYQYYYKTDANGELAAFDDENAQDTHLWYWQSRDNYIPSYSVNEKSNNGEPIVISYDYQVVNSQWDGNPSDHYWSSTYFKVLDFEMYPNTSDANQKPNKYVIQYNNGTSKAYLALSQTNKADDWHSVKLVISPTAVNGRFQMTAIELDGTVTKLENVYSSSNGKTDADVRVDKISARMLMDSADRTMSYKNLVVERGVEKYRFTSDFADGGEVGDNGINIISNQELTENCLDDCISVYDENGNTISNPGTVVTYGDNMMNTNLSFTNLKINGSYRFEIKNVKDKWGNENSEDFTLNFKTPTVDAVKLTTDFIDGSEITDAGIVIKSNNKLAPNAFADKVKIYDNDFDGKLINDSGVTAEYAEDMMSASLKFTALEGGGSYKAEIIGVKDMWGFETADALTVNFRTPKEEPDKPIDDKPDKDGETEELNIGKISANSSINLFRGHLFCKAEGDNGNYTVTVNNDEWFYANSNKKIKGDNMYWYTDRNGKKVQFGYENESWNKMEYEIEVGETENDGNNIVVSFDYNISNGDSYEWRMPRLDIMGVKLYDEDNTYLTGNAGNSIYIDGSKYTDMSKVRNELTDKKYTIVRYKVNSKNEITWIDTDNLNLSTEKDYDSLNKLYENASESDSASAAFDKDLYAFGERYKSKNPTSKDTVVFCTQKTYQDGMIYCYTIDEFVSTYAGSSETQIGELILYNTDINSMIGKAALVKRDILGIGTNTRSSEISSAAVVTKISSAVNDDNDIGYMLEVTMNDSTENIFVDSDALNFGDNGKYTSGANKYTIEVGDIIQWGSDIYGNIKAGNVIVIYDWDRDALTNKLNNTAIYKYENAWHPLWLYDKEESWLKTVNLNQTPIDKFEDGSVTESGLSTYIDYTVPINGKTVKVYVFDKTIKKLAESDLGEMQSYKQYGTDCTRMIGRYSQYGGHRIFVIYK